MSSIQLLYILLFLLYISISHSFLAFTWRLLVLSYRKEVHGFWGNLLRLYSSRRLLLDHLTWYLLLFWWCMQNCARVLLLLCFTFRSISIYTSGFLPTEKWMALNLSDCWSLFIIGFEALSQQFFQMFAFINHGLILLEILAFAACFMELLQIVIQRCLPVSNRTEAHYLVQFVKRLKTSAQFEQNTSELPNVIFVWYMVCQLFGC